MITVHHLDASRSHRILWLLEELGCPYQLVRYQRDPSTLRAPAALERIHPLGKSPVITDGDVVVAESGAIIDYLVDTYGNGRLAPPAGTPEHRRYRYWLHYAEGSAMPLLLLKLVFRRMPKGRGPVLLKPLVAMIARKGEATVVDPQLARHADFWEAELAGGWFTGGDFSAADIQMSYPVAAAVARAGLGEGRPAVADFLARVRARPAFARAEASGGAFVVPG